MKAQVITRFLFALGLYISLAQCQRIGESSVYLIPNHFAGTVLIAYGQPNGMPLTYEQGTRVYRIPSNGLLRTQAAENHGWHAPDRFFYVNDQGQRVRELLYVNAPQQGLTSRDSSEVICSRMEPVTNSETPPTHYLVFSVSRIAQIDSVWETRLNVYHNL